jgi:hypothetical protein
MTTSELLKSNEEAVVDAACIEGKPRFSLHYITSSSCILDVLNLHVYDDRQPSRAQPITGVSWFTRFDLVIAGDRTMVRVSPLFFIYLL